MKSDFSEPSSNTNGQLATRSMLVEVFSGALCELAKGNFLFVQNLANVLQVGWEGVLNSGFHKVCILENHALQKKF